jgi:bacteriocin biosynthesis cyclodehydratase domain-containing protein
MVVPGEQSLHIRSLRRTLMLRGRAATSLLPQVLAHLDGTRTINEIAASLGQPEATLEVVAVLERAGLLQPAAQEGLEHSPAGLKALLDSLGVDVPEAIRKLQEHRISAIVGPGLATYAEACFHSFGVKPVHLITDLVMDGPHELEAAGGLYERIESAVANSDFVLVALDRWQPALMRTVNKLCVDKGVAWIGVQPENEVTSVIGPFVIPGESACFECLDRRRQANFMESAELQEALDRLVQQDPSAAVYVSRSVGPLFEPAVAMAITEVIKAAAGLEFHLSTLNRAVAFTPFAIETEAMPVLKLPRCPVCSRVAHVPSERVWMGES